ncbi:MAG: hypothetical protein QF609_08950 [Gammaproteobacteria bacterium]|nr:hypothetical protein [Gammaproteobacteria bacterium]
MTLESAFFALTLVKAIGVKSGFFTVPVEHSSRRPGPDHGYYE